MRRLVFAVVLVTLGQSACSESTTSSTGTGADAGASASRDAGPENDASGATVRDAGGQVDGGDAGPHDVDASSDTCRPEPTLDSDCMTTFGSAAPHGYYCTDVFSHAPICKALHTQGCTEICNNRCCP